jgi:hypothetical protein
MSPIVLFVEGEKEGESVGVGAVAKSTLAGIRGAAWPT